MDTKLYNSEVRELAKRMLISGELAEYAFDNAKKLIDLLVEKGYYDTEQSQELSDEDKRIRQELRKIVTFNMETENKWNPIVNSRAVNAIRYYVPEYLNKDTDPTIADIIKVGRKDMLKARNLGKKSLCEIDDYLEGHGLSWNMDLKKYGL